MKQYVDLIERILKEGHISDDRTGTGTVKIFGHQSVYDMDDGFPLLTLKKTWVNDPSTTKLMDGLAQPIRPL